LDFVTIFFSGAGCQPYVQTPAILEDRLDCFLVGVFVISVLLLAYADDIDIITRSRTALKEAFLSLERAAGEMG